jgi:hypothetical protein
MWTVLCGYAGSDLILVWFCLMAKFLLWESKIYVFYYDINN